MAKTPVNMLKERINECSNYYTLRHLINNSSIRIIKNDLVTEVKTRVHIMESNDMISDNEAEDLNEILRDIFYNPDAANPIYQNPSYFIDPLSNPSIPNVDIPIKFLIYTEVPPTLKQVESSYIAKTLMRNTGSITNTSKELGMSIRTFRNKVNKDPILKTILDHFRNLN